MSRVSHLAITAKNCRNLADFYQNALYLRGLYQNDSAAALSDGTIDLVLLSDSLDRASRLDHIGFQVEDAEMLRQHLGKSFTEVTCGGGEGTSFVEFRTADPDGNGLQFSEKETLVSRERSPFPIRHIALYTSDPQRLADFYTSAFQMRKVSSTDRSSIFVSDGYINLALLAERPEERNGLHHFGFHVTSMEETQRRLAVTEVGMGERRPSRIPYAEYRVQDPEGNGFDISEKGWKV